MIEVIIVSYNLNRVLTPFKIILLVLKALHYSYKFLIRSTIVHLSRSELIALDFDL
jgi:hypothetical protein